MSHEMYKLDTAMYSETPAWHGLGIVVENAPSPREALRLSGLDWSVVKSPSVLAEYEGEDGYMYNAVSTRNVATIRQDTGEILGLVSPEYQIVQNEELFDLAYELGSNVKVETAGSLEGNKKVYITLKGDTIESRGDDITDLYLALINSHNGSLALAGLPTSYRIQCANTLNAALRTGRKNMYRITHNGDMESKIIAMREALRTFKEIGSLFKDKVSTLDNTDWNTDKVRDFWVNVYMAIEEPFVSNPSTEKEDESFIKATSVLATWSSKFDEERDRFGLPASAWVAANAVTNWIQHKEGKRGRKMKNESRLQSNLIGKAADSTTKVMNMALSYT